VLSGRVIPFDHGAFWRKTTLTFEKKFLSEAAALFAF
jgi:hypothetical protein